MARSVAHRAGAQRQRCGRNSGEGNDASRAGRTDIDRVCRGVVRVGTEEGKKVEARRRRPAPFWEGQVRQGAVGVRKPDRRVEEAENEQGGPCRPAGTDDMRRAATVPGGGEAVAYAGRAWAGPGRGRWAEPR
jgi:hypothetical protein